ncbi:MAG: NHLP bacteriocin system secretion protein [Firmicutes bacterium]|nr:NHLP bacteriocin system secretion protein [Bacillota bacterium]
MSQNKLFRKVSLDRLSSPEELDQRLTVTTPIGWLALIAVGMLIFSALVWGIFGSIAEKAVGKGIILSSGGITSVIHHANGQITDVSVQDGDYVEKGDVIARIEQTDLITEINQLQEDLAAAKAIDLDNLELNNSKLNYNIYGKIGEIYRDFENARANLETQRKYYSTQSEQAKNELEQARVRYEASLENFNKIKVLYQSGAISQKKYNDAERQFIVDQSNYNTKKQILNQLELSQLKKAEEQFKAQKQWFKDTIVVSIIDLENNIKKLQRDLMNNSEIVANASGRVLEMQVKKGDMVQPGGVVCTIAKEKEKTDSLEAVIYVPVEQGKKIKPGMEVNISPSTVKKEESGFMLGNVVSASEYPSSSRGMMLTLGNNELVQQLSGEGAPIEVRVELVMDTSTVSGYKWSTPDGPPIVIDGGTFCTGEVKVKQRRPISMVIPFIKKLLPI